MPYWTPIHCFFKEKILWSEGNILCLSRLMLTEEFFLKCLQMFPLSHKVVFIDQFVNSHAISFSSQRDEEACPELPHGCSCSETNKAALGPAGPPVSLASFDLKCYRIVVTKVTNYP